MSFITKPSGVITPKKRMASMHWNTHHPMGNTASIHNT